MRRYFFIISFLLMALYSKAQDSTYNHFEANISALYWVPSSAHLTASHAMYNPHFTNSYGYGTTIAPCITLNYFFENNLGIAFGYNYLAFKESKDNLTNTANVHNIRLGVVGRLYEKSLIGLFFSTGLNIVPYYSFTNSKSQEIEMKAQGVSLGVYFNARLNIHIFKKLFFITSFEYAYIPAVLNYKASYQNYELEQTETTNFNGIGLQSGLAWRF